MTFNSFRDKAQWVALTCAILLFIVDWYCRISFWRINEFGWGETTTPAGVVPAWLLLLLTTSLLSIVTLPRWQSFAGLLAVGWVIFMTMQGHWPVA